jgi:hypothetical protein
MIGKFVWHRASAVAFIIVPLLNVGLCCRAEQCRNWPGSVLASSAGAQGPGRTLAVGEGSSVQAHGGGSSRPLCVSIGVMMVACGVVIVRHLSLPVFRCSMYPRTIDTLFISLLLWFFDIAEFPMFLNCSVRLQPYLSSRWSGTPGCLWHFRLLVWRASRCCTLSPSGTHSPGKPHGSIRPVPFAVVQSRESAQLPVWYAQPP